jgi:flavodoxin
MKVLVLYDSVFGNTEKIAQAIGNALGSPPDVETRRVGDVQPEQLVGMKLLIVGSPTRKFRPTPAITGLLKRIPRHGLQGTRVAAFDTRISMDDVDSSLLHTLVKLFGYAAEAIAGRLKKKGGTLAMPPEGFIVKGTEGPLKEGELERAAAWARQIIATP